MGRDVGHWDLAHISGVYDIVAFFLPVVLVDLGTLKVVLVGINTFKSCVLQADAKAIDSCEQVDLQYLKSVGGNKVEQKLKNP